jgi:hypothetical protein
VDGTHTHFVVSLAAFLAALTAAITTIMRVWAASRADAAAAKKLDDIHDAVRKL